MLFCSIYGILFAVMADRCPQCYIYDVGYSLPIELFEININALLTYSRARRLDKSVKSSKH